MKPLRAAVVGARRSRQGTGEWVARDLARAGVEVRALVGTSAASREEARTGLAERYGIEARAYATLPELLEREEVDLVAICSPREAHLAQVRAALAAGCHVFCEKPFVWWEGLADQPEDALREPLEEVLAECRARERVLTLNCQWPFTLPGYFALFPEQQGAPLERFEMHLGPTRSGTEAWLDSGSHPLSMLYALVGAEVDGIRDPRVRFLTPDRSVMSCAFDYRHQAGTTAVCIHLEQHPAPPRPAGYALNGRAVNRTIQLPSYSLSFQAEGREQALSDPLTAAVEDFLARVRAGTPTDTTPVLAGALHLHRLARAARSAEETS